ncbi:MAG: pilus assembly protein [Pseudomonadales bacterium]|nr:pilus assembly protein [Pseudomonadales bacterium]
MLILKPSRQKGLAIVELTILLPILLLLFMATAELGRLIYTYNTLTKQLEHGARFLSQKNYQGIAGDADNVAALKAMIVYGHVDINNAASAEPIVVGMTVDDIDVNMVAGENLYFKVDINYTYRPIFADSIATFGLGDPINIALPLNSSVVMRVIN